MALQCWHKCMASLFFAAGMFGYTEQHTDRMLRIKAGIKINEKYQYDCSIEGIEYIE